MKKFTCMKRAQALVISLSAIGALVGGLLLSGCSGEQLSLGAGVIIGAVIADSAHHSPPRHRHYNPPRRGYHPPRHFPPRRHYLMELSQATNGEMAAHHFGVSIEAGDKIMNALELAQKRDFSAMENLGLQLVDVEAISKGENPSVSTLVALSRNLGVDLGDANQVIQVLKTDLANGMNQ